MDQQPGSTPEEDESGKGRAWHIWAWGCLAAIVVVSLGCCLLYRILISMDFAWSVSL